MNVATQVRLAHQLAETAREQVASARRIGTDFLRQDLTLANLFLDEAQQSADPARARRLYDAASRAHSAVAFYLLRGAYIEAAEEELCSGLQALRERLEALYSSKAIPN